MERRNS